MTESVQPAEVDGEHIENEQYTDPMQDIIAEEARQHAQEIETMQQQEEGDSAEESSTETSQETTSDPTAETANGTSEEGPETGDGKRPGIDVVLREAEEKLGKGHADVIRGMQTAHNQIREQWRDTQDQLKTELELLKERRLAQESQEPAATEEIDPMLAGLRPEQWELFDKMADARGYVKQEQLNDQASANHVQAYIQQTTDEGLEQFGEDFGTRTADGNFEFNAEVAKKCEDVFERLYDTDHRGPSAKDLYILATFDEQIKAAEERGASAAKEEGDQQASKRQAQNRQRTARVTKAQTEQRRGASVDTRPVIRKKGDSFEDTIARAAAAAYGEVPNAI